VHTYLAAAAHAAASCNTGTWPQRWKCAWDEPTTTVSRAGYTAGHDILPALILLAVVLLVIRAVVKRKSRGSPAPAAPARARTRAGGRR
jgi:hypothetical protein